MLLCLCTSALAQAEESDLAITAIKPYHYKWSEEYDIARGSPWFNLKNYVNVTVENNRNATAESFEVTLYADDKPIGSETVEGLSMYDAIDVTRYLEDYDNEVVQGDDGDNMMPANAFLVITYEKEEGRSGRRIKNLQHLRE